MPKVRLVQDISGPQPNGQPWPPGGTVIEVSEAVAAELTRADAHHSSPLAVLVAEEPVKTPEPAAEREPVKAAAEPARPQATARGKVAAQAKVTGA